MKMYLTFAASLIGAGVIGFTFGRLSVPMPQAPKPMDVSFSDWDPIRIGFRTDKDLPPGSKEAVQWLEAEHKGGRIVGQHGSKFSKHFSMSRSMGIGSNAIEFELLYAEGDGHYAILAIDPRTGVVEKAEFGEYPN